MSIVGSTATSVTDTTPIPAYLKEPLNEVPAFQALSLSGKHSSAAEIKGVHVCVYVRMCVCVFVDKLSGI